MATDVTKKSGSFHQVEQEYTDAPIGKVKPHPRNPRQGDVGAIYQSIEANGFYGAIVAQRSTGYILAGNHRYKAAVEAGAKSVPVIWVDVDDETAVRVLLADNRTNDVASYDNAVLAEILTELANGPGLEGTGYDGDDLDQIIGDLAGDEPKQIVEDEAPEPPADPVTKPGDLWLLGDHRVLCGDSTKPEDVARLMAGAKADMMFTDPPYGVNYEGGHFHSGNVNIKRKREKLASDMTAQIYFLFLPVVLNVVDGPCYMWFAGGKARDVYNAVHEARGEVHALIIWHKTNATYAAMNAQYKQRHEPCLYFKPSGSTLRWCGATTEATVWSQDRDGINEFHPTQKPVALAAKAINNHDAESVIDVFLGSGSTLIAAEQLGRKCYGMEISPAYCDVIVQRWENLTGKKAVLADE